jgi:hypothetical protein
VESHQTRTTDRRSAVPATSELFNKAALVARHPNLLTEARVQWALRNRARNGLGPSVYESRSGQLLIHEGEFISWYLGLSGRAKPRASRAMLRHQRLDLTRPEY